MSIENNLYYIKRKENDYELYLTKNIPIDSNFVSESLNNMTKCGIIEKISISKINYNTTIITLDDNLIRHKYEIDFRFSYDLSSRINICKVLEEYNKKVNVLKEYKRFKIINDNFYVCKDRNLQWIDIGHIEEVNEINDDIFSIRTKNELNNYEDFNIDIWKAENPNDRNYIINKAINNSV